MWTANGTMTFSPELEARFAKMLQNYPQGRQNGALIPDADVRAGRGRLRHAEVIAEVPERLKITPVAGRRGHRLLLDAARGSRAASITYRSARTSAACSPAEKNSTSTPARSLASGTRQVRADGQFSLEEVECMGACSWAPAILVNYDFHLQRNAGKARQAHRRASAEGRTTETML